LFLPAWRARAIVAHICTDRSRHRGLRAHTRRDLGIGAKERTFGDAAGFAGPFYPSWRVPGAWLRVERIDRFNRFEADDGALEKSVQTLQPDERASLPSASFPGSKTRQDSTFPGGQCAARNFHPPAASLRMSGMLWENRLRPSESPPFGRAKHNEIKMPRHQKPGTARVDLDISVEAKRRFASLHESLGFKTKSETFEAILYFVSTKDKIDPAVLERLEQKLDNSIELLESLS
jgi:hypothetical protein